MTDARRYDDPCGIARALDVIGDRWALLVIRELAFGPRRFLALRAGLHGISPNVLAQRLRDLESAGVVRRDMLAPPASVAVYELTERGRELRPVLLALGRWGSQEPVTTSAELSVSALLVALQTVYAPGAAGAPPAGTTFELGIDGDWYQLAAGEETLDIRPGRTGRAAATLEAGVATLRAVAFGREPAAGAERAGRLRITGDRSAAESFASMFALAGAPA
jgi:DNA-binding HxlR family transcriptional regulator